MYDHHILILIFKWNVPPILPPSLCHRARVWHSWSETGRVYRQSQLLQLQSVGIGGDGGSQQTLTAPHNTTHFLLQILQTLCLLCPLQQSSASLVPHSWCLVVGVRWFFVMSCVVDCWVSRFFCRLWSRQVSHLLQSFSNCDEHSFRGDCWLYIQRILNN